MDRTIAVLGYEGKVYALCLREDGGYWECHKYCQFHAECSDRSEVAEFCKELTNALKEGRRFHFEEVRDG